MGYVKIPAATNRTVDFTSSGTWTCPSGVYSAEFLVVGAGGGGGGVGSSVNTRYVCGGGGGGGAVKKVTLPVTPGNSYTITVGAKGTGISASAGNNGGFSEVVLSGITLVRSYGGGGGRGVNASDTAVSAADSGTKASTGGLNQAGTSADISGGGGGGANTFFYDTSISARSVAQPAEGGYGKNGIGGTNANYSLGGFGVDGFGAGGGGGLSGPSSAFTSENGVVGFGAGKGVLRNTAGSSAGNNATISGCGGGGAALMLSTTSSAGGDGADGLVRITYFA